MWTCRFFHSCIKSLAHCINTALCWIHICLFIFSFLFTAPFLFVLLCRCRHFILFRALSLSLLLLLRNFSLNYAISLTSISFIVYTVKHGAEWNYYKTRKMKKQNIRTYALNGWLVCEYEYDLNVKFFFSCCRTNSMRCLAFRSLHCHCIVNQCSFSLIFFSSYRLCAPKRFKYTNCWHPFVSIHVLKMIYCLRSQIKRVMSQRLLRTHTQMYVYVFGA